MKAYKLFLKNYKCFENVQIELHKINCAIGENSSGKTVLLETLEITLGRKIPNLLSGEYFHDLQKPVSISIEFTELSVRDREILNIFSEESSLTIVWKWDVERGVRVFYKSKQPIEPALRPWCLSNKAYKKIPQSQLFVKFYGSTIADYLETKHESKWIYSKDEWENAARHFIKANSSKIEWETLEIDLSLEQLGFLPAFYQVPPFYNFSQMQKTDDMVDPISRGVSKSLREANESLRVEVQNAVNNFMQTHQIQGYDEITNIANIIADFQTSHIEPTIYFPTNFEIPSINLSFQINDGIKSDLQQKGHGLRRLILYAQLIATIKRQEQERSLAEKPPRNYIIGIEELELYLHPIYQTIFLEKLKELVETEQYQVIYTSHLPNTLDAFDMESVIRISRGTKKSQIFQIKYSSIANKVNSVGKIKNATRDSVQERIGEVLDVYNCQGLFSRKVILVEGNTERYSLPQFFNAVGYKFEKAGISVIPVGGKGNLDKFIFLMSEFGIPNFTIFDFDKEKNGRDRSSLDMSERLSKLLKIQEDFSDFY